MQHGTCNGWTNYPTWVIGLWLESDYDEYVRIQKLVTKIKNGRLLGLYPENNYGDKTLTTAETIALHLKQHVKNWARSIFKSDNVVGCNSSIGDFYVHGAIADLYGYMDEYNDDNPTKAEIVATVKRGLEIVNWLEIAQHWLED
jgi:hypothetical protein